jgi:hypothetical protein
VSMPALTGTGNRAPPPLWRLSGPFDLAIYEQAHHRGGAATEFCVGLTTRVVEFAAENKIEPPRFIPAR